MQDKCENSVEVRTFYENQSQQDQKIFSPGMFHAWQDRGDMENLQFEFLSRNTFSRHVRFQKLERTSNGSKN